MKRTGTNRRICRIVQLSAVLNWVGSDSANVVATLENFSQNVLKADRN